MKILLWGLFAFATLAHAQGTVTDIDGNTYDYLTYGTQQWTVENAAMETYRDGTPIPQVTDATQWSNLTTGAWCYYDNDPTKGKLYNWYAVAGIHDNDPNTPNKEFAPLGWHVPTDAEWTTLEEHLIANGYNYDGTTTGNKIAKSMASTSGWLNSTNAGAPGNNQNQNNSSGFNALPVGTRKVNGSFNTVDNFTVMWSSTESSPSINWYRILRNINHSLERNIGFQSNGFSVRFVQNSNTCSEASINASSNNICTGESVDLSVNIIGSNFSNWNTNEPNNNNGDEHVGMLVENAKWNDHRASNSNPDFLMESDTNLGVLSGFNFLGAFEGHFYYQSTTNSTWTNANSTATSLGGYLLILNSQAENDFIAQTSNITVHGSWIGMYQDTNHPDYSEPGGAWFWGDGTAVTMSSNPPTYTWSTGDTTANISVTPTETTEYWVDVTTNGVTCREYVTIDVTSPAAPTGNAEQTFCEASTVADLTVTGDNIQWYDAATGGNLLDSTTALTDGQTVYATQTVNGCESNDRLEVTVSIQDITITASASEVCAGESVDLTVSSGLTAGTTACTSADLPANLQTGLVGYWPFCGNANDESGNGNNGTVNGATLTTDRFGNADSAYSFDGVDDFINRETNSFVSNSFSFSLFVKPNSEENIYNQGFVGNTGNFTPNNCVIHPVHGAVFGDPSQNAGVGLYVGSNGIMIFEHSHNFIKVSLSHEVVINDWVNIFISYDNKLPKLYINGEFIKSGVSDIRNVYASVGNDNTSYENYSNNGIGAGFNQPSQFFDGFVDDIIHWSRVLNPSEIQQLANPSTYTWSTGDTTANISVTPTETTEYWVDVTTNGVTCREYVTINVTAPEAPTGPLTQSFCDTATIADLTATGENIQWYDAATGGNLLDPTTALTNGQVVYASQTVDGCESEDRLMVTVSVQEITITASATEVCAGEQVDLSLSLVIGDISGTVIDIDGNSYEYLTYGNQKWTVKNAENMTYRDGTPIPQVTDAAQWSSLTTGAWCYYNNDSSKGKLYNWYAIAGIHDNDPNTPNKEFAPQGWSIPSPDDWNILQEFFIQNGYNYDGSTSGNKIAKAMASSTLWNSSTTVGAVGNDQSLNNSSGFNALAEGGRNNVGNFYNIGAASIIWSFTPEFYSPPRFLGFDSSSLNINTPGNNSEGNSVRFIKNATTYTWSTGDNTETISVTPTETTEYWVDVTTNGVTCREYVTINVTAPAAPTGDAQQTYCDAATVADLSATGENIQWYDSATGGNLLDSTTALTDGQMVYATQMVNGCESNDRLEVTVSIQDITITASASEVCAGESVDLTVSSGLTAGTTACTSADLPANLQTGLVGYWPFCGNANDESGNGNNGTVNGATLTTDRFGNPDSAYSFNGDNSYINNPTQLLEIGSNYSVSFWFSSTDVNQGNQGPYASQTLFNTIGDTGIGIAFNHVYNPGVISLFIGDGLNFWDVNGSAGIKSDFNNNQWYNITLVKNGINYKMYIDGILDIDINVNSSINYTSSVGFTIGTGSEGVNEPLFGSNDDLIIWNRALIETEVQQLASSSTYIWSTGDTTANISVTPTETTEYWVDVTTNGVTCREYITITVNEFPDQPLSGGDITECETIAAQSLIAIASAEAGESITWYDAATGGNVVTSPSLSTAGTVTYYAEAINDTSGCASLTRTAVTLTITSVAAPTGDAVQSFCDNVTVSDLSASGSNIQWFDAATGGNVLDSSSALADGQVLYASQTENSCESITRLEVSVEIDIIPDPILITTELEFCLAREATLADLEVDEQGFALEWYDSFSGGNMLPMDTLLEDGVSYYATLYDAVSGCESLMRLEVVPTVIPCEVVIYNAISLNDNGINDYMVIENAEYFPDNSLEVYNRDGHLLYSQTQYGIGDNLFRGVANVSGIYGSTLSGDGPRLPTGSYLYVFKYFNPYEQQEYTLKGFLTINSN